MKTVFDTVFAFLIGFLTEEGFFFLFFLSFFVETSFWCFGRYCWSMTFMVMWCRKKLHKNVVCLLRGQTQRKLATQSNGSKVWPWARPWLPCCMSNGGPLSFSTRAFYQLAYYEMYAVDAFSWSNKARFMNFSRIKRWCVQEKNRNCRIYTRNGVASGCFSPEKLLNM